MPLVRSRAGKAKHARRRLSREPGNLPRSHAAHPFSEEGKMGTKAGSLSVPLIVALATGCAGKPQQAACKGDPTQIAYVVARDSDDITAIDLSCMQVTASAKIQTL